jgi:hypothetical protein
LKAKTPVKIHEESLKKVVAELPALQQETETKKGIAAE